MLTNPSPDEAWTAAETAKALRCSRAVLRKMTRIDPTFPRPFVLCSGWRYLACEVRLWRDGHRLAAPIDPATVTGGVVAPEQLPAWLQPRTRTRRAAA